MTEENILENSNLNGVEELPDAVNQEDLLDKKKQEREKLGSINLKADEETNKYESEIKKMLSLRDKARENRNYKEADRIRDELLDKSVLIEDKDGKTLWKFK